MSEHVLPEDLSLWPANPWELLGVREGDDQRAVRLAYTRLIRRFKPEHFPEHFRRLRAAYEQACAEIRWGSESWYNQVEQAGFSGSDADDPTSPVESQAAAPPAGGASSGSPALRLGTMLGPR